MASIATSNITLTLDADSPLQECGNTIEYWRIASGAATGDTAVITPKRGRYILDCLGGPFSHNVGTASTNVTITLVGGTATMGAFSVRLVLKD